MYEYKTFRKKSGIFFLCEQCLCCGVAGQRLGKLAGGVGGGGGWPFWASASPRQGNPSLRRSTSPRRGCPSLRLRGPRCPVFLVLSFLRFFTKILKNSNQNMGITSKDIKYHPKPTMRKTHGWIRVFLTQTSLKNF